MVLSGIHQATNLVKRLPYIILLHEYKHNRLSLHCPRFHLQNIFSNLDYLTSPYEVMASCYSCRRQHLNGKSH